MKYIVEPYEVVKTMWTIDCLESEFDEQVQALLKDGSLQDGDKIYKTEFVGTITKSLNLKR